MSEPKSLKWLSESIAVDGDGAYWHINRVGGLHGSWEDQASAEEAYRIYHGHVTRWAPSSLPVPRNPE